MMQIRKNAITSAPLSHLEPPRVNLTRNQPIARRRGKEPEYVGNRSWLDYETKHLQWQNDTYYFSDTGNAFFSDANVYKVQSAFQQRMIKKHNINPGKQDPFWVTETMHEIFYWFFNLHYHKMRARMNSNAMKDVMAGYEWNPAENKERGIIYKREWQRNRRDPCILPDLPTLKPGDIITKMNAHAVDKMEKEAVEKIATWINYHKQWNSSVLDKIYYTNYNRLPEDEGIDVQRLPASRNLFRVKPMTFTEDGHMFDHLSKPYD